MSVAAAGRTPAPERDGDGSGAALARALFAPRTVALIGASGDPRKTTSRPQRFLARHGFAGRVVPVNPTRPEIFGVPCAPDVTAIDGPVDHAFVMVGTDAVEDAVAACAAKGVACATILASGFSEAGPEGKARQARVVQIARGAGMRLVGPNSLGVIDTRAGLTLSANAVLELPRLTKGRIGVISQSGSMIGALASRGEARGLGFSTLVSTGNEADLTVGDFIRLMVADEGTDAILLFLETVREPERLMAACRLAHEAGKPVVAYRLGRSGAGEALAVSHTGAIAGSGAAVDAFLRHAGVFLVDSFEALVEAPQLLAGARGAGQGRIAVVTTTGGGGAMMVDALGTRGATPVPPPPGTVEALAGHGLSLDAHAPLIDLTLAGARPDTVGAAVGALMAEETVDAVVMVVGSSAQFRPDLAVDPLLAFADAPKPFAVFAVPDAPDALRRLADAGIAAFRTPEACADALAALVRRTPPPPVVDAQRGTALIPHLPQDRTRLDEAEGAALLARLGLPFAEMVTAATPDDAAGAADRIGYPVALKILSPDIAHKTDAGGVVLGLGDGAAVKAAAAEMPERVAQAHPEAAIAGVLVQRMEKGLGEVLAGYRRDPVVGPIVTVAMGGVLAELYRDAAIRPAPVTVETAREMIAEVRGLKALSGWRGLPRGDLDALAEAIAALSQLGAPGLERVAEAEVNPLLVKAEGAGVAALDALVVLAP
ncbi:MAG: acetate--CoA ligase family protein [Alphaproteobacteria bacterium]|nr:acetate--CoA ligase family protein [Alphaproteobacteria bacterium]MDX5367811.1 acetate--CoA ligase family protein [Alphaproteobacteria bacterium]MDX5462697.1 acetate--CoA ligase family protein [Alphaproteobacteria bacterium]